MEYGGEAADKIIAVLKEETIYSSIRDVKELPIKLIEQL